MKTCWRAWITVTALLMGWPETVLAAISISPTTLPNWTVGVTYSQTLQASGCGSGCTWSSTGSLPPGLLLNPASGAVSGLPITVGTFNFTVKATSGSQSGSQAYAVVINPVPQITTTSLPSGQTGSPYSQVISVTNGTSPYTLSVSSGSLPAGLSLDSSTGKISGTPSGTGSSTFTIQVSDAAKATATQTYTLAINRGSPPSITTTSPLTGGTAGAAYSQTLAAAGGTPPYTWSVTAGTLPGGLSLNSASGVISGTPAAAGASTFTVTVTDSANLTASKQLSLTIGPPALTVTTASPLPGGTVGAAYSQTLAASGGVPAYSWSISAGTLPGGLSLSAGGGLSGTPNAAGSFTFTVKVTDSTAATATKQFSLGVSAPTLSVATATLPDGTVGAAYSQTLAASGGAPPYAWSVTAGALPGGLSLSATGVVSGNPNSAGAFNFTVKVTDNGGATASKQISLTIDAPSLTITTAPSLPGGTVGAAYSQTLAASGGTAPYSWSVISGALPGGLSLTAANGNITGTATAVGSFAFTVRVTDHNFTTATQAFTLVIAVGTVPTMGLTGLPGTSSSAQQVSFDLVLSSGYPVAVTGQVTLTFQPSAALPVDDPAIQFSGGGRTANFTIPANSTHAQFAVSPMALQTGTVAGTITLAVSSNLPGGTLSQATLVSGAAPVVQSVTVTTNTTGFQVQVAGFSNSRDLSTATFHFTGMSGQTVQTADLTVPLTTLASQWYSGSGSTQFGGQFLIAVPFTVQQGSITGLASVAVKLQNAVGTSTSVTGTF